MIWKPRWWTLGPAMTCFLEMLYDPIKSVFLWIVPKMTSCFLHTEIMSNSSLVDLSDVRSVKRKYFQFKFAIRYHDIIWKLASWLPKVTAYLVHRIVQDLLSVELRFDNRLVLTLNYHKHKCQLALMGLLVKREPLGTERVKTSSLCNNNYFGKRQNSGQSTHMLGNLRFDICARLSPKLDTTSNLG